MEVSARQNPGSYLSSQNKSHTTHFRSSVLRRVEFWGTVQSTIQSTMDQFETLGWLSPSVIAILSHIALESPAGFNFILRPSHTLTSPSPAALSVIRQYGIILLIMNGVLLLVLANHHQETSLKDTLAGLAKRNFCGDEELMGRICGVLSIYHVGPFLRAIGRRGQKATPGIQAYGGPMTIMIAHGTVWAALLGAWLLS